MQGDDERGHHGSNLAAIEESKYQKRSLLSEGSHKPAFSGSWGAQLRDSFWAVPSAQEQPHPGTGGGSPAGAHRLTAGRGKASAGTSPHGGGQATPGGAVAPFSGRRELVRIWSRRTPVTLGDWTDTVLWGEPSRQPGRHEALGGGKRRGTRQRGPAALRRRGRGWRAPGTTGLCRQRPGHPENPRGAGPVARSRNPVLNSLIIYCRGF